MAMVLALLAGIVAQDAPRLLVLQNLTPRARMEGAAVVVPFARGAVRELPDLHVQDRATVWQPFGARWPDGSLRQALCLFVAEVAALGELHVPLENGPGPALPTGPIAMPDARIEFVAVVGGRSVRAEPRRVEDLEANALRRVELRRCRLGDTGLVVELLLTAWRDQPHVHADVAVFCSDPRTQAMQCDLQELAVETSGMALVLRHAHRTWMQALATRDGSRTLLLKNRALGDGQGLRRSGVLVGKLAGDRSLADQTLEAAAAIPLLGATSWRDSGAFGPFGHVPEPPPWLQGAALRTWFAASHGRFVAGERGDRGDPFGTFAHGLERFAGQTGDQADFGVVKLSLVAHAALPSLLHEVEVSVLQEGCRPVHFFEADGAPVEPRAHPEWIVWSGRTHWHGEVSKDRLGKPVPEPRFEAHGWTGKDREHWSNNHLAAYALLTGAHWARRELQNEARLYLAGQTLDPRHSTSNAGAPRGGGRTALAAAWTFLCTGDQALATRMDERMDRVYAVQWAGRSLGAEAVRPMGIAGPDPRLLQGTCEFWNPWQDAIAAVGFAAHHRVTGNANARTLAEALATNVVRHGWFVGERHHDVATAIRWQGGTPLSTEQWQKQDPTTVLLATGTAFAEWSAGAVEIARVVAERDGDTAIGEKCLTIQRRLRAARRPPADGGMDRFGEWDAVVWTAGK
ncbi:MAG: hypothetical protein JNK15_00225 [Planctomycetes bacterium]|nr:hypothetical protein [Planctomycetota bacterium]